MLQQIVNCSCREDARSGETHGNYFDHAYELGLYTLPDSTLSAWLDEPAAYPAIIQRYATHPSVIGWHLADEPDFDTYRSYGWVTPEVFTQEYQQIKAHTTLPVVADFQTAWNKWDITHLQQYAGSVDMWGAEPYGEDVSGTIDNRIDTFHLIEAAEGTGERPIQVNLDPLSLNLVKVYRCLIEGARMFLFWTWNDYKADPPVLAVAAQAIGELSSLKDAIFGEDVTSEMTVTGMHSQTRMMARRLGGDVYVFLSTGDGSATQTVSFVSPDFPASGQAEVLFEGTSRPLAGGSFSETLVGWARRVYRIHSTALTVAVTGGSTAEGNSGTTTLSFDVTVSAPASTSQP